MSQQDQYNPQHEGDGGEMRDLLPLYALGGLSDKEARQVEVALDADPLLEAEYEELAQIIATLPYTAPPIQPSAAMTDDLLDRVTRSAAQRFGPAVKPAATAHPTINTEQSGPLSWLLGFFTSPLLTGAALAAVVVLVGVLGLVNSRLGQLNSEIATLETQVAAANNGREAVLAQQETLEETIRAMQVDRQTFEGQLAQKVGENILLQQQVTALQSERDELATTAEALRTANLDMSADLIAIETELAETDSLISLFSSPTAELHPVGGTDIKPDAAGQIVIDPESDVAILSVSNLPPLQPGQVYQVLLIRGSEHDTAETFQVDSEGENFLVVHAPFPFSTFDTVGVSIEPVGGSVQRTGEIVLIGTLVN